MQLEELTITRANTVVRSIKFKQGLNLILDKPTDKSTQSGNNVGKTTVLRLIDYCLGSDGTDIWEDPEFKTINQEVFDYLFGALPVSASLVVKKHGGVQYSLKRVFTINKSRSEPSFFIDSTICKNVSEYRKTLKKIFFGSDGDKPSLRQLIPKFVRSSPILMSKTLKFLEYGSESDYEALHLFLFGFFEVDVLDERPLLAKKRKNLDRDLQALTRFRKEGEIEQLLLHLRREIEELGLSNQLKGEVPEISNHANRVSSIRVKAANLTGQLGKLEAEIASIQMAIQELEQEFSDVDRYAIEGIYREANKYIPELHHDWTELKEFVHNLRGNKQRFLQSQITDLQEKAQKISQKIIALQQEESGEITSLLQSRPFTNALELRANFQEKLKHLGSLEQDLQDIGELKTKMSEVDARLEYTKEKIREGKTLLKSRVGVFNKYFSTLSETLYGEQYLLHFNETEKGSLSFRLSAVGNNVGAGKKVSQTASFDLAYIKFLKETGIKFPTFVCHDGVESVHGNQLAELLIAGNNSEGQLVIATLRDKLPEMEADFIKNATILELSQDEKFFLI